MSRQSRRHPQRHQSVSFGKTRLDTRIYGPGADLVGAVLDHSEPAQYTSTGFASAVRLAAGDDQHAAEILSRLNRPSLTASRWPTAEAYIRTRCHFTPDEPLTPDQSLLDWTADSLFRRFGAYLLLTWHLLPADIPQLLTQLLDTSSSHPVQFTETRAVHTATLLRSSGPHRWPLDLARPEQRQTTSATVLAQTAASVGIRLDNPDIRLDVTLGAWSAGLAHGDGLEALAGIARLIRSSQSTALDHTRLTEASERLDGTPEGQLAAWLLNGWQGPARLNAIAAHTSRHQC